jgi:hypothetical protein
MKTPDANAASQQLTPETLRKIAQQIRQRAVPSQEKGLEAYWRGAKAREQGFSRISPYYEKPFLEAAWLRGYDTCPKCGVIVMPEQKNDHVCNDAISKVTAA